MSRRRTKVKDDTPVKLSTASIFQNAQFEDEKVEENEQEQKPQVSTSANKKPFADEEDEIANSPFPLRIIYRVQDFLNENMTLLKFVQLCCFTFLGEIIYFTYKNFDNLENTYPIIGFNVLGVFSGVVLSFIKGGQNTDTLPEFNQFYSVLFPLLYNIVLYDKDIFLANLCLNYFVADTLHPIFSFISSVMFYNIYHESESIGPFGYIQMALMHTILLYAFTHIGQGKSFKKTESQIICVVLINLLFNKTLIHQYLPLEIFQKLIISMILCCSAIYPIFEYVPHIASIALFAGGFYLLSIYQLNFILQENAIAWLYKYIFEDKENTQILVTWLAILAAVIPVVFLTVNRLGVNFRRKVWHFLIVIMFLFNQDILTSKIEFTLICLLGTIILFIATEIIRANKLTIIGEYLYDILGQFQDSKDLHGPLNLSYIYLVAGITMPIVYDYIINDKASITRYFGLIALGFGDSMASIVGRKFGSFKWRGSNKSVQGTAAFIISTFAGIVAIDTYMNSNPNYQPIGNWENVLVTTLVTGVLEGVCDLNDNLLVPVIMPIILEVLNKSYP